MKANEVKFTRKFNVGNYESEEYSVSAIVEKGETIQGVFADLKKEVEAAKGSSAPAPEEDETEETEEETEEQESEEDEGNDDAEADDGEQSDDSQEEEEQEEDSDSTGRKAAGKKTKKTGSKTSGTESTGGAKDSKGKKFKSKAEVYDRENDQHTDIFSGILRSVWPKWKESAENRAKAKKISQKMEGEEFLDKNGKVVLAFENAIKKHIKAK